MNIVIRLSDRRKRMRKIILIALLLLASIFAFKGIYSSSGVFKTTPPQNNGKRFRVAFYQGGDWVDYQMSLSATIKGLMTLHWLPEQELPVSLNKNETKTIWSFLATKAKSPNIEFVKDAYYDSQWDEEKRIFTKEAILTRLREKNDIDLIFALGTNAGKDLATLEHSTPVIVMSVSDPVKSKISKTNEDSGIDHVFVKCDPNRYIRRVRLFHRLIGFKKVGVFFNEKEEHAKFYSNILELEKVAKALNFEVIKISGSLPSGLSRKESIEEMKKLYNKIIPKIDAYWLSANEAENSRFMPELLKPFFEAKIPTFASGVNSIKKGSLFGLSTSTKSVGLFYAKAVTSILNGVKPRSLTQIYSGDSGFSLNLETARRIGYKVPKGILSSADRIYENIEGKDGSSIK